MSEKMQRCLQLMCSNVLRKAGYRDLGVDIFKGKVDEDLWAFYQSILTILYDIESSGQTPALHKWSSLEEGDAFFEDLQLRMASSNGLMWTNPDILRVYLEHMLCIDYGLDAIPSTSESINQGLTSFLNYTSEYVSELIMYAIDVWAPSTGRLHLMSMLLRRLAMPACVLGVQLEDVVLMLHHFHTHQVPISSRAHLEGHSGYTGVVNEMVEEIGERGPERLQRKLWVDLCDIIPAVASSEQIREQLALAAIEIAAEQGILLLNPFPYRVLEPGPNCPGEWLAEGLVPRHETCDGDDGGNAEQSTYSSPTEKCSAMAEQNEAEEDLMEFPAVG